MTTITAAVLGALVAGFVAYLLGLQRSRHERLEEQRAVVLAEMSGLLFDVEESFRRWYTPSLRGSHTMEEVKTLSKERGDEALKSLNALSWSYHRNVAWLDPEMADRIEHSIGELQEMFIDYGRLGRGNTYFQVSEKGVEIAQRMESRIPEIRQELVREFRMILEPYGWWKYRFLYRIRLQPPGE